MAADKELYAKLSKALDVHQVKTSRKSVGEWNFPDWIASHIHVKRSGHISAYSFSGYEPLLEIARHLHEDEMLYLLKGTQIGISTLFIALSLYFPYWRGLDSAYCLPDKTNIRPFMKTRFGKEQVELDEPLRAAYNMHESDLYYDCGQNFLYFIGANVLTEQLTKPLEKIILDEVTVINVDAIERIEERLDAASFPQLFAFAREIYPGGPADAGFQSGRQNVCLYKCSGCNHEQNLEEIFYQSSLNKEPVPRCVRQSGGRWQIICEKCGVRIDRKRDGRWVAKFPEREINSYRIPQLIIPGMDLVRLMRRWLRSESKRSKRAKLHSSTLGIPDAGDMQRIDKSTLVKLKRDYDMRAVAEWSVGGMDMGDTCYIVFMEFAGEALKVSLTSTVFGKFAPTYFVSPITIF